MKIIVIGCPGSGKSVLTKRLNKILNLPVLHLDKVYHTGGKGHISREMLVKKVDDFTGQYDKWIIDGNYFSTLEQRVKLADAIVLLNMPTDRCLQNAYKREDESKKHQKNRDDMAEGFDYTMTQDFILFIKNFKNETLPEMIKILDKYKNKVVHVLSNQDEVELFIGITSKTKLM